MILIHLLYQAALHAAVIFLWFPRGKNVLFVSSDSTIWREYMQQEVLAMVADRAFTLNWSERNRWSRWNLKARLFHSLAGGHDFNPMVVLFRPFLPARTLRYYPAFRSWKAGDRSQVEKLTQELRTWL